MRRGRGGKPGPLGMKNGGGPSRSPHRRRHAGLSPAKARSSTLIRADTRGQPPLTCWTPEIVPWAVCSAELTDEVPVIAAWIAVQMACDTFG
jgi:hypothetical protein